MRNQQTARSYNFRVVIEPDEDRWFAYCPALEKYAAATWGNTYEEAYQNIQQVIQMVIDEFIEDGTPLPGEHKDDVQIFSEPRVMVTV